MVVKLFEGVVFRPIKSTKNALCVFAKIPRHRIIKVSSLMSSSTSLASARRRKGNASESVSSMTPLGMMSRMSGRIGMSRAQPASMTSKQSQPKMPAKIVSRQYVPPKPPSEPVTRSYDGLGEITKFEQSDNVNPYQQTDGKVLFGIQDIVKIHEKKLVQHELSLSDQSKIISEIEEQTIQCIQDLDAKCESLHAMIQTSSSGDGPGVLRDLAEVKKIRSDIEAFMSADTKQENGAVNELRAEVDQQAKDLAEVHDEVKYLKQMFLQIQASHGEMSRTVMRLLDSSTSREPREPREPREMETSTQPAGEEASVGEEAEAEASVGEEAEAEASVGEEAEAEASVGEEAEAEASMGEGRIAPILEEDKEAIVAKMDELKRLEATAAKGS